MNGPDCIYCNEPAESRMIPYGDHQLHEACYQAFGQEMADAFPDEFSNQENACVREEAIEHARHCETYAA